nr:389_t:CDS:2 [Entrophospora candida]
MSTSSNLHLSVVVGGSETFYKFTPAALSAFLGDNVVFKKYAATKTPLIRLAESDSKDACIRTKRADAYATTAVTFTPAKAGTYYVFDLLNTDCSAFYNNWFTLTVDSAPANAPKAPAQPTTQSTSQPPAQPTSQPPAPPTSEAPAPPTSKSAASSTSESPAAKSSSTSSVSQPPGTNSSSSTSQSSAASSQSSSSDDSPKPLSTELIVGIVGSVTGGIFAVIAALITVKYLSVVVGGSETFYKFTPAAFTAILGDNVIFKKYAATKTPLIRLAESDSKDACIRTKRADAFYGELPDSTTAVTFTPAKVGTYYVFDLLNTDCSAFYNNWFTLTVEDAPKVNATQSTIPPNGGSGAILGGIAVILGIIAYIVKAKYSRKRENFYIYNEQNNTLNEQNFNQQNNSSVAPPSVSESTGGTTTTTSTSYSYDQTTMIITSTS